MKKVLQSVTISIILLAILVGVLYGVMIHGIPLEHSVGMGIDAIVVPTTLTEQEKELTVMSFNIKCIDKLDKEGHNWTNRKESVQTLIDRQEADIIGFQEVTHPQYKFFIDNMGDDFGYYGIYRSGLNLERADKIFNKEDPKPTIFNRIFTALIISEASPIFYNKSRYELLDHDTFWLSNTPEKPSQDWDTKHRRICTYVALYDHYTNKTVNVLNTHFDNSGDIPRVKSAELVNQYIAEKGLDNVIVMGDFNAIEDSPPYNELISKSLSNTKYLLPEAERSEGPSSNGFGKFNHELPIDHIFIQQECFTVLSNVIVRDMINEDTFISDHFPVVSVLKQK
ncbi:MAG: endonuclease/exonuclease/phosphatase family protein [Clostridia bacterium]|nr:endonuclease/exonuclease/phosphatase family protein [Clostridia bacterium]